MNLVEASKQSWSAKSPPTLEQINSGCFQRIAAAAEVVAENYLAIIGERNYWRSRAAEHQEQIIKLTRSYSALRANYTRLKAKSKKSS